MPDKTSSDIFSPKKRSEIMSRVKSKNTKPELTVRSMLHSMGYRFRLHRGDLPGKPDIILPKYKAVIFVHGCFWHQHPGCKKATIPQNNSEFWQKKLKRNLERDIEDIEALQNMGWKVSIVWECQTRDMEQLHSILKHVLNEE